VTGPVILERMTRHGRERAREAWTGNRSADLSQDQFQAAARAGYEPGPEGYMTGRDPRRMSPDELRAMGHEAMCPLQALRLRLGLTRVKLARLAGTSNSAVQHVEERWSENSPAARRMLAVLMRQPILPWPAFCGVSFPGDGTARIRLRGKRAQGREAIIDAEDAAKVEGISWWAQSASWPPGAYYAAGWIDDKSVPLHRYLLDLADGVLCDHENGDRLDCRRDNLRVATNRQNMQNRTKHTPGTSVYKGVHRLADCSRWRARITIDGKRVNLGLFATEEEAAQAYDRAAVEAFGEWARINFPWRAPPSEAQRKAGLRLAARMRSGASDPSSHPGLSAGNDSDGAE
jgi:DNA-binding transcriptional regulator YiaG